MGDLDSDLPPLGDPDPFGPSELDQPDALDEAIAELQSVVDQDRDHDPFGDAEDSGPADIGAVSSPAAEKGSLNDIVMAIPVQLDVVIGSAQMPVSDLIGMEAGAVVALDRKIGEPVDICVNGTKVATGEIQTLDDDPGRLGIKILALGQM